MVLARLLVLATGSAVTVIAVLAYWRTRAPFVRSASVGFAAITLGAVVEGVLYHAGGLDLVTVHTVGSLIVGVGFAALLYSLLRRDHPDRRTVLDPPTPDP